MQDKLCIDFDRIYAVGNGAGAALVEKLACGMPQIKAFATMSHRSPFDIVCPNRAPIPYMHFTAKNDGYLPPEGGVGCYGPVPSLAEHEVRWRARNFCDENRTRHSKYKRNECSTWGCDVPFVSCQLDAGRGWPKRENRRDYDFQGCDGDSKSDYDMAGTIWSFFMENTGPAAP